MIQKQKRKNTPIYPDFLIADGLILINSRRKYQEGNKHGELCKNERTERTVKQKSILLSFLLNTIHKLSRNQVVKRKMSLFDNNLTNSPHTICLQFVTLLSSLCQNMLHGFQTLHLSYRLSFLPYFTLTSFLSCTYGTLAKNLIE